MRQKRYRLDNYIITEHDRWLFTWEQHITLGTQRSGKCFMMNDILIIETLNREDDGYLILEYHDQLMKLPVWNKTYYYCFSSGLRDIKTGRVLSPRFPWQQVSQTNARTESIRKLEPGVFRLDRYKIMVSENSEICWHKYMGLNKTESGQGNIVSGILFLTPKNNNYYEIHGKKEWFGYMESLPRWEKTVAWSYSKILKNVNRKTG